MATLKKMFLTLKDISDKKRPPSSVEDFMKHRQELFQFVSSILETRIAMITAPVKSGKKDMVILQALLSAAGKYTQQVVHYYVTALERKELGEQEQQLKQMGVTVLNRQKKGMKHSAIVSESIKIIEKTISEGKRPVIHFDESDYGTDWQSKWSPLLAQFIDNKSVSFRLYSATNEELELSKISQYADAELFVYSPPEVYRGAKWFLENKLVREATPFFEKNENEVHVTNDGNEILEGFLKEEQEKPILIVRYYSDGFNLLKKSDFKSKMICEKVAVHFVDHSNNFDWAQQTVDMVNLYNRAGVKTLIVLNAKASRSTEIYCQKWLYGFHDYRPSADYNTHAQSSLRPCSYNEEGYQIIIWTCIAVMQKAAQEITTQQFLESGKRIGSRVASVKKRFDLFDIYEHENNIPSDVMGHTSENRSFRQTVSGNNSTDVARLLLEDRKPQSRTVHVDSASPTFQESWEELEEKHPELIGKWLVYREEKKYESNTSYKSVYQNI